MRAGLAAAIEKVASIKEAIAAIEAEQDVARVSIRQAAAEVEAAEKALDAAAALERRSARAALQTAKENLEDFRDHLSELKAKVGQRGSGGMGASGLGMALDLAELAVRNERSKFLAAHPSVVEMLRKFKEARPALEQLESDLLALERVFGVHANWNAIPANEPAPKPSARLLDWIDALTVDAGAEMAAE